MFDVMTKGFGILLLMCSFGCTAQKEAEVFLFSYFQGRGEDGLHLAYSPDGYQWKALNDNRSLLKPAVGEAKLMRDPCIIRGPEGTFHLVWTTGWHEKGIGYASSENLIDWSEQRFLPVMDHEPEAKNCWAPELFYDDVSEEFMIYWSTTISGKFPETANTAEEDWNHRIYYTTTKDFENFSETKLLYDPGFNVIDAVIVKEDHEYLMVVKNETKFPEVKKDLHISKSEALAHGYGPAGEAITDHWVEGPTITKAGDKWIIYFDRYRAQQMGAIASDDLENWEDISSQISFPDSTRHGTVFKVSGHEFAKLTSQLEEKD